MLKNTIKDLVTPESNSRSGQKTIAYVLKADEKNNLCTIKYKDVNGVFCVKDNVQVSISNADNWFPCVGDPVVVKIEDEMVLIISRIIFNYQAQKKKITCGVNNFDLSGGVIGNVIS